MCDTEVMVIRAGGEDTASCGGAPTADQAPADKGAIDPGFAEGTKIGKRYVDEARTLELLCVKGGKNSLSLGGAALQIKDAKPLPSSD